MRMKKFISLERRALLGGLCIALTQCADPVEPPAGEHVRQLVDAAWETAPPAAYLFSPPCTSGGVLSTKHNGFTITRCTGGGDA